MKTKKYLVLFLAVLLLIATGCTKNGVSQKTSDDKKADTDQEEVFTTTPEKMIALGKSFQCDFSYQDENQKTLAGKFFVDGKNRKFRTEVNNLDVKSNKETTAFMIFDKETMYVWSDDLATAAVKMTVNTDVGTNQEATKAQQAELEQTATYKCHKWSVDDSKFVPPANINFMDFNALMNSYLK